MALKTFLSSLLLAAPLVLAHPGHEEHVYAHSALPLERKSLAHCKREFEAPEFIKRTVEIHGEELARLRRQLGIVEKYADAVINPSLKSCWLTNALQAEASSARLHFRLENRPQKQQGRVQGNGP
jgi:hypothetical protein